MRAQHGDATGADSTEDSRLQTVAAAVERWVSQLVDMTGRNRMLFYRTLKRGTLELTDADSVAVDALLSGRKTRLTRLFRPTAEDPERLDEALKSARTIYRKARELLEERGIATLFVTVGHVSWTTDATAAAPAAPLLMAPLSADPVGSGEVDYAFDLDGDWRVNDTLLLYLEQTFGVRVDAGPILEALAGDEDMDRAFEVFLKQAQDVPDVQVVDRRIIGTFQYTKLPMVRDLQDHVLALADNDVVAAIAGDDAAKQTLRSARVDVDPGLPNLVPPADEFLVLDADSSQNLAINAAVGGESLIIQGPPGTGKSQTIANLIATMIARGRTVLFVAEKRAAIDAVRKRLDQVGLADAILDLHGGISSRRELAQALAASLEAIRTATIPKTADNDTMLMTSRSALVGHAEALHRSREPFGISVHEAYLRLAAIPPEARVGSRFDRHDLEALDETTARQARQMLREWAELTEPFRTTETPWAGTTIKTHEAADEAFTKAAEVAEVAEATAQDLRRAVADAGVAAPTAVREWKKLFEVFGSIDAVLVDGDEALLDRPIDELEALAVDLEPGHRSVLGRAWGWMFSSRYRKGLDAASKYWRGEGTPNGRDLVELVERAIAAVKGWGSIGGRGHPRLPSNLDASNRELDRFLARLQALGAYFVTDPTEGRLDVVPQWSERLVTDRAILYRLPRIAELEVWFDRHRLTDLIEEVDAGRIPGDVIADAFDHALLMSIVDHVTRQEPALATFDPRRLDRQVRDYATSDRSHIAATPLRIRRMVAERAVAARNERPDQDELIRGQARKKRGHLPLRELFTAAPDVLTALRPCWTMSPLLVSQVLPPAPVFDVVVFDEASQIRPADAIPALLRGHQAVVAGDHKQLPPTAFFDTAEADDDDEAIGLVGGFESILDVLGVLLRNRTLTWHYRSEDERLIAFSNHAYYGGGLTTFPGAAVDRPVRHVLVPHRAGMAVDTRSSDDEVKTVVELMIDHARQHPEETLGVIAMGIHHAKRIDAALRGILEERRDEELDTFFSDAREERTFVKNLETVQGDERDAIILTIGYTKQPDGRLYHRFGPINNEGGERRLNVAVTRARKRITVVSGFSHTDMDPSRLNALGARHLYEYLKYAETGGRELSTRQATPLNPFELAVLDRLRAAGLTVVPQYGQSGYRIDFAIVHPDRPGEFVLAVEADGASYHSTPTARDRDRLRQQVLERFGWRFHRIWSTAWFRDPEGETQAVLDAVTAALDDPVGVVPRPTSCPAPTIVGPRPRGPRPRIREGPSIGDYTMTGLVAMVRWVRSDGVLRTDDELLDEVMTALGFHRRGKRIVAALTEAIERERRRGR